MTVSVSASIVSAVANRDRASRQAAATTVWTAAYLEAGFVSVPVDPLAVHAALAVLGLDVGYLRSTARELRLVREGQQAEAPGGAIDQADRAKVAAFAELDAINARARNLRDEAAKLEQEASLAGHRAGNLAFAADTARRRAREGAARASAIAARADYQLAGGWELLPRLRAEAAAQAAGGTS